jgi:plasmid stability protein
MEAITIPDLPADVLEELAARAARSGRSLEDYLRRELIALAHGPTNRELIERVREQKATDDVEVTAAAILDAIAAGREER